MVVKAPQTPRPIDSQQGLIAREFLGTFSSRILKRKSISTSGLYHCEWARGLDLGIIQELERHLTAWLGDATTLGASSWLEVFTWIAALFIALTAGISLRRQSLQHRAVLLLNIYTHWKDLSKERENFAKEYRDCQKSVVDEHKTLKQEKQLEHIASRCHEMLARLRDADDPKFKDFVAYITFFEILGGYVRNGYLPMRDILQLYKGPILDLEVASRSFIEAWQQKAHMPPGLLEHALYLMRRVRAYEDRPIYYRTWYQVRRVFLRLP